MQKVGENPYQLCKTCFIKVCTVTVSDAPDFKKFTVAKLHGPDLNFFQKDLPDRWLPRKKIENTFPQMLEIFFNLKSFTVTRSPLGFILNKSLKYEFLLPCSAPPFYLGIPIENLYASWQLNQFYINFMLNFANSFWFFFDYRVALVDVWLIFCERVAINLSRELLLRSWEYSFRKFPERFHYTIS